MTIQPGLVSVTFRQLTPKQVIDLCVQAGVAGIEWGGDVHVPHGDMQTAMRVGAATEKAGLRTAAYGSYYRLSHDDTGPFDDVVLCTLMLKAPVIRVWAGRQGSAEADDAYWRAVVDDARRIADIAGTQDMSIALEFHRNTLTDTTASTVRLLQEIDRPNVYTYWQAPRGSGLTENLAAMQALSPWLYGLHVFAWHEETDERLPLSDRIDNWRSYLAQADALGRDMYALIEFVKDDEPDQFVDDAATLEELLSSMR